MLNVDEDNVHLFWFVFCYIFMLGGFGFACLYSALSENPLKLHWHVHRTRHGHGDTCNVQNIRTWTPVVLVSVSVLGAGACRTPGHGKGLGCPCFIVNRYMRVAVVMHWCFNVWSIFASHSFFCFVEGKSDDLVDWMRKKVVDLVYWWLLLDFDLKYCFNLDS